MSLLCALVKEKLLFVPIFDSSDEFKFGQNESETGSPLESIKNSLKIIDSNHSRSMMHLLMYV